MERIEIKYSRWKWLFYALLAFVFVALGVIILFSGKMKNSQDILMAWACIFFFGLGLVIFTFKFFQRSARLIIDSEGVEDVMLKVGKIRWEDIEDVYVQSFSVNFMKVQEFLCLKMRNIEKYTSNNSFKDRALVKVSQSMGFEILNLNIGDLEMKPKEIVALIQSHLLASRQKRNHF